MPGAGGAAIREAEWLHAIGAGEGPAPRRVTLGGRATPADFIRDLRAFLDECIEHCHAREGEPGLEAHARHCREAYEDIWRHCFEDEPPVADDTRETEGELQ